jgi:recombination protein RecA
VKYEVIKKQGNTHSFGEVKLGVGREQTRAFLKENPKIGKDIEKAIWKKVREAEGA